MSKYNWDKWFQKKSFKLVKGVDYECMTHSMAQQVRNEAAKRGFYVSVKITTDLDETILIKIDS